jgi:uncharacterized protein
MKPIEKVRVLIAAGALSLIALGASAEPALWHISDADSDIYIMGTVHVLPPGIDWKTPRIQQAFDRADTVWFEAPANDPAGQLQMVFLIQQYGLNPAGVSLSSRLSPGSREALKELATRSGLPVEGLEPLRPWLAAVTLTAAYAQAEGYDPASGVEAQLWPLANEQGKALDYFETLEEQIRFFADLPEDVEIGLFDQTVAEYNGAEDELDALVQAWQDADLASIDQLVNGEMRAEAPEIYEVVIARRNARWVEKIRSLLDGQGTHFIALGAGHLAGEAGVVEGLRNAGITVQGP